MALLIPNFVVLPTPILQLSSGSEDNSEEFPYKEDVNTYRKINQMDTTLRVNTNQLLDKVFVISKLIKGENNLTNAL